MKKRDKTKMNGQPCSNTKFIKKYHVLSINKELLEELIRETKALEMIILDQNCIKYFDEKKTDMNTDNNNKEGREGVGPERICYDDFVLLGEQCLL